MSWTDVKQDTIFTDFIISAELEDVSLETLQTEIRTLSETLTPNNRSGVHGYQTPTFTPGNDCTEPELNKLLVTTINFADKALDDRDFGLKVSGFQWWANLNTPQAYNNPHVHGRSDLIALFYPKLPKNSGSMNILRNDGSVYTMLYINKGKDYGMKLDATPGRLYLIPGHLWHFVDVNESDEERMSVAYNLFLDYK